MEPRKQAILNALQRFVAQRPGLEFANYGDVALYRAEMRSITKDRHHAEELIRAVSWRDSITANDILKAADFAHSGRLAIRETEPGAFTLDYCTGQYWPTEYRRAVANVLSSALWNHWRTDDSTGDSIRATARRELSRGVAQRFFR